MKRLSKKVDKNLLELLLVASIITLLSLTLLNITNYLKGRNVLGVASVDAYTGKDLTEKDFWANFVAKNPNYIPGWIELGRWDKVREIDPNYEIR